MSTATLPDTFEPQTASRWAVETHGLTKRFGENVAVNNVELLVPRGCAVAAQITRTRSAAWAGSSGRIALISASGVNTGRKLTPFHRSKTDPPSRVTDRAA